MTLQVDFRQESGLYIRNIISESDAGLNMTYTFEFEVPNAEEGSEAAEKELTRMKGVRCSLLLPAILRLYVLTIVIVDG